MGVRVLIKGASVCLSCVSHTVMLQLQFASELALEEV